VVDVVVIFFDLFVNNPVAFFIIALIDDPNAAHCTSTGEKQGKRNRKQLLFLEVD